MTCFPIFYAVIENDLRKVLAYSLINQLGFMVCGIGIGTALAMNGAVAHAFNDVIFKGLLFMTMGAVLTRVGHVNGSNLGGLHKTMPKTTLFCIVGAASISAFPLFSGFVSKSMVMAAMIEAGHDYLWLMLLFASAGVFHHAGIKIPFFAFFAHDSGLRPKEAPTNMLVAMGIAASLCIIIGSYPEMLYQLLPWESDYKPYDITHTLTQLQLLAFSALAFVWLNKQGLYPPELKSVNLDVEFLYRKVMPSAGKRVFAGLSSAGKVIGNLSASAFAMLPIMRRNNDASAATLTLRMVIGFVLLALIALITELT
jgi:multicomponent Na+:H+ antiporter subunit D